MRFDPVIANINVLSAAGLLAAALALPSPELQAQPAEWVYGPQTSFDAGARRVTPVRFCGTTGGYFAVGTTQPTGLTQNTYLIRTTAAGAPVWENSYDVGATAGNDRGQALAELSDGSGVVVAGVVNLGTTASDEFYLMKVNCAGIVQWTWIYTAPSRDAALDVIEARTGNTAAGTAPGDLVVAGFTTSAAGNSDAVLFRTRSNGALIWNRRYDLGGASEIFRALTEARPTVSSTGDIVAAGSRAGEAYAARVSGDTGLIGAAPQCAAMLVGPGSDVFQSVIELRTAPFNQNLAFVGSTSPAAGTPNNVYLVRTGPNVCAGAIQRAIGGIATIEDGFDLRELSSALALGPVGTLVLTGSAGAVSPQFDATLIAANPGSLVPIAGTGRQYGDHAALREVGVSLAQQPTGMVIAGVSDSNLEGAAPADPRDLYLVSTDPAGNTNCSIPWAPPNVTLGNAVTPIVPAAITFLQQFQVGTTPAGLLTGILVCP